MEKDFLPILFLYLVVREIFFSQQIKFNCINIIVECANFRSMLNCVNNLEPQSMNSGIERAALMISEEKNQQDSRKTKFILIEIQIHHYFV